VQLDRELATQQVIVESRSVIGPVARAEHRSVDAMEKAISVEVLPGTEVLRLTVASRSAARARRVAQRVADTYIELATGSTGRTLQTQLVSLRARLASAQKAASSAKAAPAKEKAQHDADDALRQIDGVRTKLAALPPSGNLHGTPRTLASAHVLSTPLFPRPVHAAGLGALVGILIASVMTFLILRRQRV
jgi:capsular polysaccharide biosynthesis protein